MAAPDGPSNKPPPTETGPAWATHRSILDILDPNHVTDIAQLPISPPTGEYIAEAVLGLRYGPGDAHAQRDLASKEPAETRKIRARETAKTNAAFIEQLETLTKGASAIAVRIGDLLFWVALGGIFGRIPVAVLNEFKDELSERWHHLCLQMSREIHEPAARDWALQSLPIIYAQSFYRILCDGFQDDRPHFIANGPPLLDKLTLVCHFEVTGFQMTVDSARKARRRLFMRSVIQNPHVNQLEFLRGKKRQEELENAKTVDGDMPLVFGDLKCGRPLEETQLEHVMYMRREDAKRRASKSGYYQSSGSKSMSAVPVWDGAGMGGGAKGESSSCWDLPRRAPYQAPPGLGVDSYESLLGVGCALQDNQIAEMINCLARERDTKNHARNPSRNDRPGSREARPGSQGNNRPGSRSQDRPGSRSRQSGSRPGSRGSALNSRGSARTAKFDEDAEMLGKARPTAKTRWNTLRAVTSMTGVLKSSSLSDIKELEAKIRRSKLEAMHKSAANDVLPAELCERALMTTWVSPMVKRLAHGEGDRRCILNKTASEAFSLKMAANPLHMMHLPLSKPSSPRSSRGPGPSAANAISMISPTDSTPGGGHRGTFFPPIQGADSRGSRTGELLTLEPPRNLSGKVIVQRLESEALAFRKGTFAEHVKEIDMLTGEKKNRIDETRLRKEEDKYLFKMQSLVGGPPSRLTFLNSTGAGSSKTGR